MFLVKFNRIGTYWKQFKKPSVERGKKNTSSSQSEMLVALKRLFSASRKSHNSTCGLFSGFMLFSKIKL